MSPAKERGVNSSTFSIALRDLGVRGPVDALETDT